MKRQCAARAELLAQGALHRGWKVGLTTAASRAVAGITDSLVGFLTASTELRDGAELAISGWERPMIEGELAIEISADVSPDADEREAQAAIGALAVAIEIVDLTLSLEQVEDLLAGDIFHRHFLVGAPITARAGGDATGIAVRAWLDDQPVAVEEDPCAVIGRPPDTVRLVARELAHDGLLLKAGDVILGGSAIPLTPVSPGQRLRVEATSLGELGVSFTQPADR